MHLNLAGYGWIPVDGYGRLSLGMAQALLRAGHDVYPFEIRTLSNPAWFLNAQGLHFDHVTVQLCPPHEMRHLPGRSFGYTMHESMTLPRGWSDHINQKCQWLLVPSPWLVDLFADDGVEVPIEVVPGGIDPDECHIVTRSISHHRPYTFMCLGDRSGRKGDQLVWSAFYKAFDYGNKDVRLTIKCRPGSMPNLDFSYGRDERLTLWRADVEHIGDIYAQADAYMFPSHCEGFGMPCREAAACGLPTVVTRFSGMADDCDEWAIPLENFKLVESYMEGCGGKWAQSSLDELVWRMRDMYENQDKYRAFGLQAAQWMRDNATYAHAAHKMVAVLNKYLGGPPPEREPEVPIGKPVMNVAALTLVHQLLRENVSPNGHKEPVREQG